MDKNISYPYCDFYKFHDKKFNYGLCPCGDSFVLDNELRCSRTPGRIKKYISGGYYYKCNYMRVEKNPGQIRLF